VGWLPRLRLSGLQSNEMTRRSNCSCNFDVPIHLLCMPLPVTTYLTCTVIHIATHSLCDCFDHLLVHTDIKASKSGGAAAHRVLLSCCNAEQHQWAMSVVVRVQTLGRGFASVSTVVGGHVLCVCRLWWTPLTQVSLYLSVQARPLTLEASLTQNLSTSPFPCSCR